MSEPQTALIIPFYNESRVLQTTIEACLQYAATFEGGLALVFVDDGSTDGSRAIAARYLPRITLLSYPENRGKGYAVRTGMLATREPVIATTDADLAYGLQPVARARQLLLSTGAQLVCGTRRGQGDAARYPLPRRAASAAFAGFVRLALGIPLSDTQCGLKCLRGDVGRSLFSRCTVDGFSYDLELLALAAKEGAAMAELPVTLLRHGTSTVSLLRDGPRMLAEALRIRAKLRK